MTDVAKFHAQWQKKDDEVFRIRFSVLEPDSGRVILTLDDLDDNAQSHWVEFKMWDYETMVKLRKQATRYDREHGMFTIDQDLFNTLKIKNLMKSWSFGEVEARMKLHHVDGAMTDESFKMFDNLYPCVALTIIDKMNKILEGYE